MMAFLALFLLGGFSQAALVKAADYQIVVHESFQGASIAKDDIKAIFLGKKKFIDGAGETKILPVMLKAREQGMPEIIKELTKKTVAQFSAYWKKRMFSGYGGKPKEFKTAKEAMTFVTTNNGAIALIPAGDAAPAGTKVVPAS